VSADTIEMIVDRGADVALIPIAAIAVLEVSAGRRHSRALATVVGVVAGLGGFMAGGWLGLAACGSLDCDVAPLVGVATGTVLGAYVGRRLGREQWQRVTPAQLGERIASSSRLLDVPPD
jgi:hypothetical protein